MLFIKDIKSFEIDGDLRRSTNPIPIVNHALIVGKQLKTYQNISKSTRDVHSKELRQSN